MGGHVSAASSLQPSTLCPRVSCLHPTLKRRNYSPFLTIRFKKRKPSHAQPSCHFVRCIAMRSFYYDYDYPFTISNLLSVSSAASRTRPRRWLCAACGGALHVTKIHTVTRTSSKNRRKMPLLCEFSIQ